MGSIYCDNTNTMTQNCTLALLLSIMLVKDGTLVSSQLFTHTSAPCERAGSMFWGVGGYCLIGRGVVEMFSGHL